MLPGHPAQTSCGRQAKKRREGEDMLSPADRGEHLLSQIILQEPLVQRSRSDKKKNSSMNTQNKRYIHKPLRMIQKVLKI